MRYSTPQLRRLASLRYGDSLPEGERVPGPVPVFGSNGQVGWHDRSNTAGATIVVGRKGSFGKVHFSQSPVFAIDTTFFVDEQSTWCDIRWLAYALCTLPLESESQDVGVPGLSRDFAYVQRVPTPTVQKQRRIADYLDVEVARIDELISAKQETVRLLNGRVDALIGAHIAASALVAGEAAGRVEPIGRRLEKLRRPAAADSQTITAFRDGQVTSRGLRRADGYTESWTENSAQQGVETGDVVIHGLDGFAGAIGVAEASGACSPVYHVCRSTDGDADFLARLLRLLAVTGYLSLFATSTRERAVDFRNWDRFRHIPIPEVPAERQREIGDMIRSIGPLRVAAEEFVALLQERRGSLVTAVVAGEMEVP